MIPEVLKDIAHAVISAVAASAFVIGIIMAAMAITAQGAG